MVAFLLIIIVFGLWAVCFLAFNDLLLPSRKTNKYKNILCIFAHMDDETVLAGGLMSQATARGQIVTLLTLTRGEKGNDARKVDANLPAKRRAELANALDLLNVKNVIHLDYGDDTLTKNKAKIKHDIDQTIKKVKPDLVVTFDLNGWYGHADHIACAEAVTEVVKKKFPKVDLWYVMRSEAINRAARLVARMRGASLSPRSLPGCKVFIGSKIISKINAIYCYHSQMSALRPGITVGPIPMWFFLMSQPYEYIIEA